MFKNLNIFEKWYLILGLIINIAIAYISRSSISAVICAICSLFNAVYVAKGNILSYVFGLIATATYIFASFTQKYYSEVFVNIILLFITIYGFINWSGNHNQETDTITIKKLTGKEIFISILSQVLLFYFYYRIFRYFGNSLIIVSTINLCLSVLSFYYNARMSKISFVVLIIGGIFKTVLWAVPMLRGDLTNTSILVSCLLYLVCDTYGYINWSRLEKIQNDGKVQ